MFYISNVRTFLVEKWVLEEKKHEAAAYFGGFVLCVLYALWKCVFNMFPRWTDRIESDRDVLLAWHWPCKDRSRILGTPYVHACMHACAT